jgi:adenylate cyclase
MKRCPECRRDYYDDSLFYCLDDGSALLEGPASGNESATAIFPNARAITGGQVDSAPVSPESFSPPASIAVLPFTNMSADDDNEYFCDGLAEELINALSNIDELKVAARTSSFSFRGKDKNISEIGAALSARTVLEGSVRRSGTRLRITAQLVNTADGYHLWSERYDREMKDILDVQDEITLAVVDALKVKLLGRSKAEVLKRQTENPDAHKAYLLGRHLRHTKNDHGGAREAFEEAVRLDPSHAPSWIGLAEGTILAAHYSLVPSAEACLKAKKCLAVAEDLRGESADMHYVRGFIAYIEADWKAWEKAHRRAIALQPEHVQALGAFGLTLCLHARFDEALGFFARARAADPLAPFPYAITGAGLVTMQRFEDSLSFFDQARTFDADNLLMLWGSCIANISLGKFNEGIAAAERAVEVSRRGGFFVGLLGWAYAVSGATDRARNLLEELSKRPPDAPTLVSQVWLLAAIGENEAAFELLERAESEPQAFAYYVNLPTFDPLHGDARFADLIRRKGLPDKFQ